jgi:hypothetical protein
MIVSIPVATNAVKVQYHDERNPIYWSLPYLTLTIAVPPQDFLYIFTSVFKPFCLQKMFTRIIFKVIYALGRLIQARGN